MNTPTQYDEVGRSKDWQANIWTGDHATKYIFDNGYMVSLLWGEGSYGSMNEMDQATSYEVAVLTPSGDFLKLSEWDDVIGGQDWLVVEHILAKVDCGHARELEKYYK
jgi:hypothetical protein